MRSDDGRVSVSAHVSSLAQRVNSHKVHVAAVCLTADPLAWHLSPGTYTSLEDQGTWKKLEVEERLLLTRTEIAINRG